jgi:HAD superfamily hydrolase (TIGR01509 family)
MMQQPFQSPVPDEVPRAVLFDCDGVLVDSEPALARIAALALRDFGLPAEAEDFAQYIGMGEDSYIGGVARKYGGNLTVEMKDHVYEKYIELCAEFVHPMPGAVQLIRQLQAAGFRLAMATSADRVKAEANLALLGLGDTGFDVVITGTDVVRKKPFPDIYLLAAEKCGVSPANAFVIEDAESGVQAAKAAGMHAIALTSSLPAHRLLAAGADDIVDTLDAVSEIVGI